MPRRLGPPLPPSPACTAAMRWARRAAASAVAGLPAAALAQTPPTTLPTTAALVWLALGALLSLAVLLGYMAWQQRQRQGAGQLDAQRARAQRLSDLIDAALWSTDAEHRLTELRSPRSTPQGAPQSALPTDATGHELWSLFDAGQAGTLKDRLQARSAFDDVELVQRRHGDQPPQRWRLRGVPRLDAKGRFGGFEGTAQPLPPAGVPAPAAATNDEAESFSYTVSHDLRAPIRVVEGFTRILKEDYGRALDRVGNEHLDRVLGAAARMNSMIDALLALSRLSAQPVSRQTVNLSQLAGYVIEDLRRQHPERRVEVVIAPQLQAYGDATLLRVALENLLGNAWKYSAPRSVATIEFGRVAEGGRSAFCVADNGCGFDMRFADRLFGVFQRLHSVSDFAGTGVGLASVRRIVQRHGGEIWAESEPDRGARFYFTLP